MGTGRAESFEKLGKFVFQVHGMTEEIEYIDMPENLCKKYQYYTRADIEKLENTCVGVS